MAAAEYLDLASMVDEHTMQTQDAQAAAQLKQQVRENWQGDNRWTLGYLQAHVDELRFPDILEEKASLLRPEVRALDSRMVLRPLSWMPDISKETADNQGAKIRAVCGSAVLLASSTSGVNANKEYVDEMFYALGVAVEQGEQLRFYRLFSEDLGAPSGHEDDNLYHALAEKRYRYVVARHKGRSTDKDGAATMFDQEMQEVGQTPTVAQEQRYTKHVHRLLLGETSEADSARRANQKSPSWYASKLADLIDFQIGLDRTILSQTLDDFLKTSQTVKSWLAR